MLKDIQQLYCIYTRKKILTVHEAGMQPSVMVLNFANSLQMLAPSEPMVEVKEWGEYKGFNFRLFQCKSYQDKYILPWFNPELP